MFRDAVLGLEPRLDFVSEVEGGDVNGDGFDDVVALGSYESSQTAPLNNVVLVFLQNECGTLNKPQAYPSAGSNRFQGAMRIADVTGDGRNDVIATAFAAQLFEQTPIGTLQNWRPLGGPDTSLEESVATADFDRDGRIDVALLGNASLVVLLQRGGGTFDEKGPYAGVGFPSVSAGDVNGDGKSDIVVYDNTPPGRVRVLTQTSDGVSFAAPVDIALRNDYYCDGYSAVGDVTGDGREDVVVSCGGNTPEAWVGVLAQTSEGSLSLPHWSPSLDIPRKIVLRDIDGNGRLDVVVDHEGNWGTTVALQQRDGTLAREKETRPSFVHNARLTVADVNGDGKPDLVHAGDRVLGVQLNAY